MTEENEDQKSEILTLEKFIYYVNKSQDMLENNKQIILAAYNNFIVSAFESESKLKDS